MYDGFSKLPGCTAIKQDGLYVGIEDPYFGVIRVCSRSPDSILAQFEIGRASCRERV